MMISAARTSSRSGLAFTARQGMTLLEVVIALSLMVILMGLGMVKFANGEDERQIREAVARIEAMSSRGHAMSILHQKPFWLRLEEGQIILAGADLSGGLGQTEESGIYPPDRDEDENPNREQVYDTFATPVRIGLRRWGAKAGDWQYPGEKQTITWSYQSSGLCEPVAFRLEVGESWVVMNMHPLTARIESEEMEIR